MYGIDEIKQKPEILRFESSNKNLLTQYVVLEDGVVMCYTYGYVDSKSIKESHDHLLTLLKALNTSNVAQSFDMIIDFNNVKWIEKGARSYLNRTLSHMFETGLLRHIGVISENYIVRTMGGLWSKLSPWMNYTFYKSEISAYQEIIKKRVKTAKKSSETTIAQDILTESMVFYRGAKLLLYKKKDWQYQTPVQTLSVTLINSKILYIVITGDATLALIDQSVNCIPEAYQLLNKNKLDVIYEVSQIKFTSSSIRHYWFKKIAENSDLWEFRYIITNPTVSAMFKIEWSSNSELKNRTVLEKSIASTLDKILNIAPDQKQQAGKTTVSVKDYESFSKKQLIEEIAKLKSNHNERINQLFGLLSRINLSTKFKPATFDVPTSDPFYELFTAVDVVQHDFFDMLQELKGLNQNLEAKVKDRTTLLNSKNVELTQLNEELDHFVYCVSHDLRAPLTSIQGLINLMQMEKDNGSHEQYLDLVTKNIRRLDLFIQEILQLSRNARMVLSHEVIEFQKIIDNTFSELVYLVDSSRIQKNIYIEQQTPFINDTHRITVIFRNLLSNAIKYSSNNHHRPSKISIRIKVDQEKADIEITDNGMGIMKDHIDKVFEMFYRATDTNAGSGLGLYIVKQVVNKLEGQIKLSSEVGKGTKIIITLPNLANAVNS